jgi:hypothetical protein
MVPMSLHFAARLLLACTLCSFIAYMNHMRTAAQGQQAAGHLPNIEGINVKATK